MCRCKCTELALAGGAGRACGDEPNPIDRATMRSGGLCYSATEPAKWPIKCAAQSNARSKGKSGQRSRFESRAFWHAERSKRRPAGFVVTKEEGERCTLNKVRRVQTLPPRLENVHYLRRPPPAWNAPERGLSGRARDARASAVQGTFCLR
ncbi:hypothetical protein MTO96_011932 [Rhipicephalus appendiculatus]